jgi:hypothetical protein
MDILSKKNRGSFVGKIQAINFSKGFFYDGCFMYLIS